MASSSPLALDEKALGKLSAEEQKELKELAAEVARQAELNPLTTYLPYPKQAKFHAAKERIRAFYGANRVGKTHTGAADDLIQALPPDYIPEHLKPYKAYGWDEPARLRVITPDLSFTMEAVLDKFRELCPASALVGGGFDSAFDKTKRILRFAHGSRIDFMSFEQEPDKFGGVKLHQVHYDEEPRGPNSQQIRRDSRVRLTDYGGREIFTMTPFQGVSWVYDLLWEKQDEDGTFVIRAAMKDNPYIALEEIERLKDELTEEEFKIVVLGMPVVLEGLFYDEFTREQHVRKPPEPEDVKDWDVIVGIDPGLQRTGVLWVGFDNDNAACAFAELYPAKMVPADIAPMIQEMNGRWGIEPSFYVIDPAARVGSLVNAENVETEYARRGIHCVHGQNKRGPGILEVKRRLQKNGLVISEDCQNLIWELGRYRRDPNSQDEYAAIKKDDHLADALRYISLARPWGGGILPLSDEPDSWTPGIAPPADWLDNAGPNLSPPLGSMT